MEDKIGLDKTIKLSIFISILIILFTIGSIFVMNYFPKDYEYLARDGIIDLAGFDQASNKNIDLVGQWEFYPHTFIYPAENENSSDLFEENRDIRRYVEVPGSWGAYLNESASMDGAGTYRLIIKTPEEGMYGIITKTIRYASRIYMNGREVACIGNPALNQEDFEAGSRFKMAFSPTRNNEIHLVLHVSSYGYNSGGILEAIRFGSSQSIILQNNTERALDALSIFTCLTLGIYFLFLFLQQKIELYLFYYSITSFLLALHFSTMNNQLLDLLFDYDILMRFNIQIFTTIGITLAFLRFVYYFFLEFHNKKALNNVSIIMSVLLIVSLSKLGKLGFIPMIQIQLAVLLIFFASYLLIFWLLIKAIYKNVMSSEYVLVITTSLFCYWAAMAQKVLYEARLGYLLVVLILFMMIATALLLSKRFQLEYQRTSNLLEKLNIYDKMKQSFLEKTSRRIDSPSHITEEMAKLLLESKNAIEDATILLISDKEKDKRNIAASLKEIEKEIGIGINIISVLNGGDALEKTKTNKLDLIIMDSNLQDISGYSFSKIIR